MLGRRCSHAVAFNVLAVLEGELRDAGFVEFTEAFRCPTRRIVPSSLARTVDRRRDCARVREQSRCPWRCARLRKKQLCSRFCMSSPSVSSTREFAPVCEKTSRTLLQPRPLTTAVRPKRSATKCTVTFLRAVTCRDSYPFVLIRDY
jgi:hypothetical protein